MKMDFCRIMAGISLRYRDNIAIVNVERGRRYTYPEYHLLTNRIANLVHDALGLGRGDNVLLILDNDNLSLLHIPTIFKQKATFAFSNQRDSPAEHAWQFDHIKPKAVFIETRMLTTYYGMLTTRGCTIVVMDRAPDLPGEVQCFWDLVDAASDRDTDVELDSHEHVAVLRFTGGTTGRGKCAMYSIDNLMTTRDNSLLHPDFGYGEETRFLSFTPLSHAPMMVFFPTFFSGGTTYTLNVPDLDAWCHTVQAEQITLAVFVPTLLYRLLDMNAAKTYNLSSLRTIAYGASPIAPAPLGRLIEQFGSIFLQAYGATETFVLISVLNKSDHHLATDEARKRLSSAGRVSPDVEVIIADEAGKSLPIGASGEILIRSRGTIRGYYESPEDTATEFHNGYWKSGDLGYLDDHGYLFIVDRKKDMIITGGFNVYAVEVEAVLARLRGLGQFLKLRPLLVNGLSEKVFTTEGDWTAGRLRSVVGVEAAN
jgi:fatty-acyl-CoA synthase